jgi:uroporphyrinogen-III synthase
VAVTRPEERSEQTIDELEARGHEAVIVPGIEIAARPEDEIREGVGAIGDYDWIVITSAAGVDLMADLYGDELKDATIAVVGSKTASALEKKGIEVDLIPKEFKAENLAEELLARDIEKSRILVARASSGREVLVEELSKEADVTEVHLYDTMVPRDTSRMEGFYGDLKGGAMDAVIFTSSHTVKNFYTVLGEGLTGHLNSVKVCAIAPITRGTLEERGVENVLMPDTYTIEACITMLEGSRDG